MKLKIPCSVSMSQKVDTDIFMMIMLTFIFLCETWSQGYSFINFNKGITGEYLLSALLVFFPLKNH